MANTLMHDLYACYSAHAQLYRDNDIAYISPLHAMQSGAGWYAGRWCISAIVFGNEGAIVCPEPYDRVSEYFATEEEAQSYANYLNQYDD